jgi:hypothetical protein
MVLESWFTSSPVMFMEGKKEPCTAKKDLGIIEVNQDSGENKWLGVFHIFGAAGLRV